MREYIEPIVRILQYGGAVLMSTGVFNDENELPLDDLTDFG